MRLEKTVEHLQRIGQTLNEDVTEVVSKYRRRCTHLQHDALVDGELGDDVRQQQVPVVFRCRVDARLRHQTRPRERHQATQLVALLPAT